MDTRTELKKKKKRSGQAQLVYVKDVNRSIPTTRRWARGSTEVFCWRKDQSKDTFCDTGSTLLAEYRHLIGNMTANSCSPVNIVMRIVMVTFRWEPCYNLPPRACASLFQSFQEIGKQRNMAVQNPYTSTMYTKISSKERRNLEAFTYY